MQYLSSFFYPTHKSYFISRLFVSVLTILAISPFTPETNCVEGRTDNSILGYYLQLYNSINSYRSKHTIPALRWNRTLTEVAEYLAARIVTAPDSFDIGESEGINFFVSSGTIRPSVSFVTGSWYNESFRYDYSHPGYNPSTLNFTEMIWKSSTSVGIGSFTSHNHTSIVAKFDPPGNIRGKYKQNVIPVYKKL